MLKSESMHHSLGAFSETEYIYLNPIKVIHELQQKDHSSSLNLSEPLSIIVVGLGLGYIELAIIQFLLDSKHKPNQSYYLNSYEKVSELCQGFQEWVQDHKINPESKERELIYNQILNLNKIQNKSDLKKIYTHDSNFFIKAQILNQTLSTQSKACHLIFQKKAQYVAFDAFSSNTDTDLWSDDFLDYFLNELCAEDCVFSTYACTGKLRRSLIKNDFLFIKRPGFSKKRDSTLALRGKFKLHQSLFQSV